MENEDFGIFIDIEGNVEEENTPVIRTIKDIEHSDKIIKQVLREFWEEKKKNAPPPQKKQLSMFEQFYEDMGWHGPVPFTTEARLSRKRKQVQLIDPRKDLVEDHQGVHELLKKSMVLKPEFNDLHTVPAYDVSEKKLKQERQKEREKSKGRMWYNLPATEVTEEIKKDLEILKMRSVLDPKHFYKKNDIKVLPKYFQIGKVMDSPLDYHERLTKKERKKTLVDELLSNAEFEKYNKKKYAEIIAEKQKTHYAAFRQAKKLKRKKK